MSDSALAQLHQAHRSSHEQTCFFLLAAAASAVAFAVQKTGDATLSWPLSLLAVATLLWGGSFYCGVKQLQFVQSAIQSNFFLLQLGAGSHSNQPITQEELQIAIRVTKEWVGKHSMRASTYGAWQLRLLLLGSGFFIAWHIWAIVQRTYAP